MRATTKLVIGAAMALMLTAAADTKAATITVTVKNNSETNGVFFTPFWFGLHDGNFDLYDRGEAASQSLERIAEDGDTGAITAEFGASRPEGQQATVPSATGALAPGQSLQTTFKITDKEQQGFLSYASMVIPSNDAFVANGNPQALSLFDENGRFTPIKLVLAGTDVLDAGTEVNTEMDAAFFDQMAPDAGIPEGGTVQSHPGFLGSVGLPDLVPIILGGTSIAPPGNFFDPSAADFLNAASLLEIHVTPIPGAALLFASGVVGLAVAKRRRRALKTAG